MEATEGEKPDLRGLTSILRDMGISDKQQVQKRIPISYNQFYFPGWSKQGDTEVEKRHRE